jgi:hypothetical protein
MSFWPRNFDAIPLTVPCCLSTMWVQLGFLLRSTVCFYFRGQGLPVSSHIKWVRSGARLNLEQMSRLQAIGSGMASTPSQVNTQLFPSPGNQHFGKLPTMSAQEPVGKGHCPFLPVLTTNLLASSSGSTTSNPPSVFGHNLGHNLW